MRTYIVHIIIAFLFTLFVQCTNEAVDEQVTAPKSWTVMVYADSEHELEHYMVQSMQEIQLKDVTEDQLRLIVLLRNHADDLLSDKEHSVRLFEISYDSALYKYSSHELAVDALGIAGSASLTPNMMADWYTLASFVTYCKQEYVSDGYALIIEHQDDQKHGPMRLQVGDIRTALVSNSVDIICFDSAIMATIETAYELRDCASYIVASPGQSEEPGVNYHDLLLTLNQKMNIAEIFTRGFFNYNEQAGRQGPEMVCIDTAKISHIINKGMLDRFVAGLGDKEFIDLLIAREASEKYQFSSKEVYIDCIDFVEKSGATELALALKDAIISLDAQKARIAIYFPTVVSYYDPGYSTKQSFGRNTQWDAFLVHYMDMIDRNETSHAKEQHEPADNFFATACPVENGGTYQSYLSAPFDIDIYTFTVTEPGEVNVLLSHVPVDKDFGFSLSSLEMPELAINIDGSTQPAGENEYMSILLGEGTYYVKVYGNDMDDYSYDQGDAYQISFSGEALY